MKRHKMKNLDPARPDDLVTTEGKRRHRPTLIFQEEIILGFALALEMLSLFIKIHVARVLLPISEDFYDLAGYLASPSIRLFLTVLLAELATADIFRQLKTGSCEASLSSGVWQSARNVPAAQAKK
jgi:hypothetical protein